MPGVVLQKKECGYPKSWTLHSRWNSSLVFSTVIDVGNSQQKLLDASKIVLCTPLNRHGKNSPRDLYYSRYLIGIHQNHQIGGAQSCRCNDLWN